MNKLYLDIETIPAHENQYDTLKTLLARRRKRRKATGEKCLSETLDFEQYLLGTSFDGAYGRILCIAYAINDRPVEVIYSEKESEILEKFWSLAKDSHLYIGHNIMDFDMRFIYQRSIVNRVKPTKILNFARYRNDVMYDTMREWVKWANANVGLEHIALSLGIPTPKNGIDGSQVFTFYKAGKIKEILEYCKRDVAVTRAVYKRMTFDFENEPSFDSSDFADTPTESDATLL